MLDLKLRLSLAKSDKGLFHSSSHEFGTGSWTQKISSIIFEVKKWVKSSKYLLVLLSFLQVLSVGAVGCFRRLSIHSFKLTQDLKPDLLWKLYLNFLKLNEGIQASNLIRERQNVTTELCWVGGSFIIDHLSIIYKNVFIILIYCVSADLCYCMAFRTLK